MGAAPPTGAATFLIMRRMRAPLIVLILVFSISVVGLTLIPGAPPGGGSDPMSFFDAFYFISYTATTIGFGEIPYALTVPQRAWVTLSIFWAVIGWAYAIGTLLSLLQDRAFRREVSLQRFARRVRLMPEPFLILVGYGQAGALVAQELDRRGRRLVVVDKSAERIDALHLAGLRADVPAISADTRHSSVVVSAGLNHPRCVGVLALTDDESNKAAVQAAYLLRPDITVISRATNRADAETMRALGSPTVVDPFDAFGDRLRVALRTPTLVQLFDWLVSPRGQPPPPRIRPPAPGRWVIVGHSRSTVEVASDLRAVHLPVVVLDPGGPAEENPGPQDERFRQILARSVGLVVAADHETDNVTYIQAARRARPDLFIVARHESVAEVGLIAALQPDLLLVPAAVVARQVLERLANPALWDFVTAAKGERDAWAEATLEELIRRCGLGSPDVWQVRLDEVQAPALTARMAVAPVRLGDLLGSPFARDRRLPLVPLMLDRGDDHLLMPSEDLVLEPGDTLLAAGGKGARRGWDATLAQADALDYVLPGQRVTSAWWSRWLGTG